MNGGGIAMLGNLKISVRLGLGFGLLLVLMIVMAIVGLSQMKNIDDKLERIVTVNNAQVDLSNEMLDAVHVVNRNILTIAMLQDGAQKLDEKKRMDEARAQYNQAEEKLGKLISTDEGKVIFEKVKQVKEKTRPLNDKVIELAMANKRDEAMKQMTDVADPEMDKWRSSLRELNNYADSRTAMRRQEAVQAYDKAHMSTILISSIAVLFGALMAFFLARSIVNPVANLARAADIAASGDLTVAIAANTRDEIGKLAEAFKTMIHQMRELVGHIKEKSVQVAGAAQQLSSSSQQTAASANETAATMGEITTTVEQVAANTQEISKASENANKHADEGNKGINKVDEQMRHIASSTQGVSVVIGDLSKKSQEINQIVELITSIADQTNLLALNAAIEAARAGEQGRGFAVVAEEVRKLAEQSASAAKEIYSLINAIQVESQKAVESMAEGSKEVEAGTAVVQEVGESFGGIIGAVQSLASQIEDVAAATEQMSAGVQNVAAATEEETAAMEEVSASAEALTKLSEDLNALVGRFKVA